MKKHSGMRPQDVVILLKIVLWEGRSWKNVELAQSLYISSTEISDAIHRNQFAKLLDERKAKVKRLALYELIRYGLPYMYPAEPGKIVNGIPTAHSHPELKKLFSSDSMYVWPDPMGDYRGQEIEPFYAKQTNAIKEDPELYLALSMIDILRVGRVREKEEADSYFKNLLLHEPKR